jgi:eukaryotic-like serine/threonine-protein kinase
VNSRNPERWQVIEAALEAALQVRTDERPALLTKLCGDDEELRREVDSLLAAHAAADGFLTTSAESFASPYLVAAAAREPGDAPEALIGRYRLIEEIGRGGMGRVWLASRADGQFDQQVALKLVKRGMDTDEILARFLRERQILALLEHPNIARLLDGGVSEDGRPYFVMEHIVGRPITEYCDEKRLSVDDRLRLFAVVARAVAFAHRNLVVHRDIKPSNVLVDETGTIKLLDFGIAKLLGDEEAGDGTGTAGRLMTPEYASPEQAAGMRVTTSSDVFQLGILLYELLAGRRPNVAEQSAAALTRRPSAVVRQPFTLTRGGSRQSIEPAGVSEKRGTTTDRLHRRLRGDLDTIVLRTLRDEPDRRYPSALDLAEDVERHLAHLPIRFGTDLVSYRLAKFVRRHRLTVTMSTVLIAITVATTAYGVFRVSQERDRARYEADKAVEVSQLMARFLQGWSPDASDRGEVSTKTLLADAVLRAERELTGRPDMLGATLSALGDFHTTIGEWATADSLLSRAQSIQSPLENRAATDLAATLSRKGRLYRLTGKHVQAQAALRQALAIDRLQYGASHLETLRVLREIASLYREQQRFGEAESLLRGILGSVANDSVSLSPFALEVTTELAYTIYQLGRFGEAESILRQTLERQRALFGELNVATLNTMRSLGSAIRDEGRLNEAEQLYRDALRLSRALYGDEHVETDATMFLLALVLERKYDLAAAEVLARREIALVQRLFGPDNYRLLSRRMLLASIRLERGDAAEAERLLRRVRRESLEFTPNGGPDDGDALNRLAFLLIARNAADAQQFYRDAVAFDDARPAGQPDFVSDGLHYLAWSEHKMGDLAAAEQDYQRALTVYQKYLPASHPYREAASQGLAAVRDARARLK